MNFCGVFAFLCRSRLHLGCKGQGGTFGCTTWVFGIGILGAWMKEIICHWGEGHWVLVYQAMRGSAFGSGNGKKCEGRETEQESKHLSHVCRFASTECLEVEAEAVKKKRGCKRRGHNHKNGILSHPFS